MVISSPKHKIPTNVYSPFTFVLGKDIIILSRHSMVVLLNPVLLSGILHV